MQISEQNTQAVFAGEKKGVSKAHRSQNILNTKFLTWSWNTKDIIFNSVGYMRNKMPRTLWLQPSKSKLKNTQFTLMSNENSSGAGKKFLLERDGRASICPAFGRSSGGELMTQYTEKKSWQGELFELARQKCKMQHLFFKIVLRLEIKAAAIIPFNTGK